MSMSLSVYGIVPPDDKWTAMKAVFDACKAISIEPPNEVAEFFDHCNPDPLGVIISLYDHSSVEEYEGDYESGYIVDLKSLPKHIKQLKFVIS